MTRATLNEGQSGSLRDVKVFSLDIVYNGITKQLDANPKAAVEAALQHAIKIFGIAQNAHLLSFFTQSNVELADKGSFEDQMIQSGSLLLLRPGAVKGGVQ